MKFSKVCISATAVDDPPEEVTSAEIEERLRPVYEKLGLPEGRLELMTGIQRRRFYHKGTLPSEAAARAAKGVLENAPVGRSEIDAVVHCAVCRDRLEPATAAYVHGMLGLPPSCQILDLSNACLGFVNGMVFAAGLLESGQARHVLLVAGENGRPLLENTVATLLRGELTRKTIKPYFANLTIGAGAAAMLLSREDAVPAKAAGLRLLGGVARTDSESNQLCQGDSVDGGGQEMLTDAGALLEAGISLAQSAFAEFLREVQWKTSSPDCLVCHQVGRTHQRKMLEALGLDPARDFVTFPDHGNMGSVSLPYTLHRALGAGRIGPGQRAALLGIGSGLSTVMLGVERVGPGA